VGPLKNSFRPLVRTKNEGDQFKKRKAPGGELWTIVKGPDGI
jgi:hypothetical protein